MVDPVIVDAQKHQPNSQGRRKAGLVECSQQQSRSHRGRQHEPGSAAHPKVRNGAPEEVDCMRESDQRNNAGAARGIDALKPKQIGERAAGQADRHHSHGRDEEVEEPGTVVRSGLRCAWRQALSFNRGSRLHVP